MQLTNHVAEFLQYCTNERRLSENTVDAYGSDLSEFRSWLQPAQAQGITTDALRAYLNFMVSDQKLSTATVKRRLACLRGFFRWLAERQTVADPFTGWKTTFAKRKQLPRALSRTELLLLLERGVQTFRAASPLEYSIVTAVRIMVATGLRVGEVCKLRALDVAPDGTLLHVRGKGSRERIVYVSDPKFRAELARLARERQTNEGPLASLLVNRLKRPLQPQSIRQRLHCAASIAGLARRVTPHMLRHTAATLLIEKGVDIRIVQRLLGHSTIATTEIYTHVSDEALRRSLEQANVLGTLAA